MEAMEVDIDEMILRVPRGRGKWASFGSWQDPWHHGFHGFLGLLPLKIIENY